MPITEEEGDVFDAPHNSIIMRMYAPIGTLKIANPGDRRLQRTRYKFALQLNAYPGREILILDPSIGAWGAGVAAAMKKNVSTAEN